LSSPIIELVTDSGCDEAIQQSHWFSASFSVRACVDWRFYHV